MSQKDQSFILLTHVNGLTLGKDASPFKEVASSEVALQGAVDLNYSENNFLNFMPVVPKGLKWGVTGLKEAVTVYQKSAVLACTTLEDDPEHELIQAYLKFWSID